MLLKRGALLGTSSARDYEADRRIKWDAATVLSLVLCLAAAGDWVNSYRCYWFIQSSSGRGAAWKTRIAAVAVFPRAIVVLGVAGSSPVGHPEM